MTLTKREIQVLIVLGSILVILIALGLYGYLTGGWEELPST